MTQTHHEEHNSEHLVQPHEEVKSAPNEIEQLKAEILSTLENKKDKAQLPWGSLAVTIVLAILTLLSVIQTVQSAMLLNKLKSGNVNLGGSAQPAALQDAPNMVGGC